MNLEVGGNLRRKSVAKFLKFALPDSKDSPESLSCCRVSARHLA